MKTAIARFLFPASLSCFFLPFCASSQTQKVSSFTDKKGFAPLCSIYIGNSNRIELTSVVSANLVKVDRSKKSNKERYIIVYTYEYTFINRSNNWVSLYFINAEAPSSQLVLKPWEERREILITERVPEIFSANIAINIQVNREWFVDGMAVSLMYLPASIKKLPPKAVLS